MSSANNQEIFVEVENEGIKNYTDSANEKFQNKTVSLFLENEGNVVLNKHNLKNYLITINFDPTTSYIKAWSSVQGIRNNLVLMIYKEMEENENNKAEMLGSTIEHTHYIPENRKKSKVHQVKTNEELLELFEKFKKENPNLYNIDVVKYTINLLNYYTEMKYTANINKTSAELVKYFEEKIEELTPIVDNGSVYNFEMGGATQTEYYKMTKELFLAHCQTESKSTTVGYPHIHIGLWTTSTFEPEILKNEIYKIVVKYSQLKDVDVAASKKQGNPTKTLEYLCKNHSSKTVYDSLVRHSRDPTIVKIHITSSKYYKELKHIINHISNTKGENKLTSNSKSKYNHSIALKTLTLFNIEMLEKHPELVPKSPPRVKVNPIELVDAEKSKTLKYINLVQRIMLKHSLVICDGYIYKKIKNSKSSYMYTSTIEQFVEGTAKDVELFRTAKSTKTDIISCMKSDPETEYKFEDRQSIDFPRIKINYRMIEYRDFYYCLITRQIYKTQVHYHTYLYCPEICLDNLSEMLIKLLERSVWIKQLKASGLYHINEIAILFTLVHNRKNIKNGTIALVGPSDTGKSTIPRPFIGLFPGYLVGHLKAITEHHIHEQIKDKKIVLINEGNGAMRGVEKTVTRADSLLVMGGETAIANEKHGAITAIDTAKCSLIMTCNIEIKDENAYNQLTMTNRLKILLTKVQENEKVAVYSERAAKTECPLILLFSGMCSAAVLYNFNYIPNIIINDELSGENLECIKIYDEYESDTIQAERNFDDDILRYSDAINDGFTIPTTTRFETGKNNLPKYSNTTNKGNIDIILADIERQKIEVANKQINYYERSGYSQNVNIHANVRV
jgi:hypothetical protein